MQLTGGPQAHWVDVGALPEGPLKGLRVLDLSAFAVGPWAAALLAALGADVLKVDPPYGDHIRNVRPTKRGEPTTYTVSNLGKRSIILDLKADDGRAAALQLASEAAVVVENSRAGAMDRLGMGFADVQAVNAKIVYCSSSSFGDAGPMASVGSTDPQGQAFSGFVSINGDEGRDPEFLRYSAAVDLSTSVFLVQGCLLGLHWRQRNGKGCHVTTSQFEGALAIQITRSAEYLVAGTEPAPLGSANPSFAPSDAFRCRDGRYVAVSAQTEEQWCSLCDLLGLDPAADQRFADNGSRLRHRAALREVLAKVFGAKDLAWWRYRLGRSTVPHAEYAIIDDVVSGTSVARLNEHLAPVPHPTGGTFTVGRPPWRFSRTPAAFRAAPAPGEHQDAMFRAAADERQTLVQGAQHG